MTLRQISSLIQSFKSNERGSVVPIFASLFMLLIMVAGVGVDYSKIIGSRQKIANAIDAAALAVAAKLSTSLMTDSEIAAALRSHVEANLQVMGVTSQAISNLGHKLDPTSGTLDVWSSISVDMNFVPLGGIGPEVLNVDAATQVSYSSFDVELALVVDVTGSMKGDLEVLKTASSKLVSILLPEEVREGKSKVRISLIPYSEGVNAGKFAQVVTNGGTGSRNCVTERAGLQRTTDIRYNHDAEGRHYTFFGAGSNRCSSNSELIPLTDKPDILQAAITKLTAEGGTAGQTGIAWGWYTLSPNWTNLWPIESHPEPYNTRRTLKFAVVMTDGEFNRHYNRVALDDEDCEDDKEDGYVTEQCRSGTNYYWKRQSSGGYMGQSSVRARAICDAMKAKDITLYTVYFGDSATSTGARIMSDCATAQNTFFMATSSQGLVSSFESIARSVQSIYLAK